MGRKWDEKKRKFSFLFWEKIQNFRASFGEKREIFVPKSAPNASKTAPKWDKKDKKARPWDPNRPVSEVARSEDRRLNHYAKPTCARICRQKCENTSKITKPHPKSPKSLQNRQIPSKISEIAVKSLQNRQNSSEIAKIPPKTHRQKI